MLGGVVDLFAPAMCIGCKKRGSALCARCASDLPAPISQPTLPHLASVGSPWFYEGYARDLILALKLRGRKAAADPLGAAIAGWIDRHGMVPNALTWVPGRRRDMRTRGFDHAEAIALVAASLLGIPAIPTLTRALERPDQTTLDAAQRRRNLVGAFTATTTSPRAILLIDDLMTTGATLTACARALKAAGAGHIEAVTACRV